MLTCSEARKRHEAADGHYPGESYFGPWAEPTQYLEDLGKNNCVDGTCERCNQETVVYGYVVDRWMGVQICQACVREIRKKVKE